MTPTLQDDATNGGQGQPLLAERWLLASDDDQHLFALPATLAQAATQSPLLAWRLQHGLVQRLPLKALPEKLTEALASGAAGVNLWAEMDADALDTLVWAHVPVDQQALLAWQAWPADAEDAPAAAAGDRDAALLQALARPDAWAEVGWRLDGCASPPAVLARRDGDTSSQLESHAAAFSHWADAQWQGLDADTVAALKSRDALHADTDLPLDAQPMPDDRPPPRLLVLEPGVPVRQAPARHGPALLQAKRARASAAGAGDSGAVLQVWENAPVRRKGPPAAPVYQVRLRGNTAAGVAPRPLQVQVLLQPATWAGQEGLQLWFVPEDDQPLLLALRPPMRDGDWLTCTTPLPLSERSAADLAAWLQGCGVELWAEVSGR
jgi:hypothetical protein